MRNRADRYSETLNELRQTKKQILTTLFQLERNQRAESQNRPSTIRIIQPNPSPQIPLAPQERSIPEDVANTGLDDFSEPTLQRADSESSNVETIASAVVHNAARLMEQNPDLAASLLEQLNGVLSRRRRNDSDTRDTRDAVYDQVMRSYAVERFIDQLIPQNAETTVMSPMPEKHVTEQRAHPFSPNSSRHSGSSRDKSHSRHPERKKASRQQPTSSLLTAGMIHPSIQVKSVRSPATPQFSDGSVPSTPMSPKPTSIAHHPSIPDSTRVGNKRKQSKTPERPGTPGEKKRKE